MKASKLSDKPKIEDNKPAKKSELEVLKEKNEEYLRGWQRAQADYQNLLKEVAREKASFARYAKSSYVLELLPLYNNLQMAFMHLPLDLKDNDWIQGMIHIKDQFSALLKEMNVEPIRTKGEKFNPVEHEAVARENDNELETDMIVREVSAGYKLDGEVLVPAKVVVAE